MLLPTTILTLLAITAHAATNEPCYGPNNVAGVCLSASACSNAGGTSHVGYCKADAASIKCCTKPKCGTGSFAGGNCRWVSDCAGSSQANQCPGPGQMKCCSSSAPGFGGYADPTIPKVGACKSAAVAGAKKIVAAFPGSVREIGCVRDCACPGTSDHCCGLATDMMISDNGGYATLAGQEIAEWVMKNRNSLSLKYVIWGQKIWSPSQDKEKSWTSWRTMEDRGSLTANHWDHVHVSYKG
ncbi:hypothetical protein B0T10DRAFT_487758 [Thelonectria olida]|uniref:ARB-07466-like C-terminal domain-containing protein n=1 Tax=Thelonectria olida TaxID=1576542 RepID=A0A9P8W3G1_9HYPO|nr:hypothetical protein B0T10DRAFT_487758 [Thelonectria olida]